MSGEIVPGRALSGRADARIPYHATRRGQSLWLPLAFAACCAALLASGAAVAPQPVVILLSWDGVRHDYPDRTALPALARMAQQGVRAARLLPVFPSTTFPNHVALATGTYPDRHGILDNQFCDRARGFFFYGNDASWLEAEPLWVSAERQGVKAGVFFWVVL
jgi:predicted AlkP superfamily pyrophosphatase or phosphodiesterase